MIIPYFLRLLCLCLASFFLAQLALGVAVWLVTPAAIRLAERTKPRASARLLFLLRMAPALLAGLLVFGLGVPSYIWLEPRATDESVSLVFCAVALLGAALWCFSIARVVYAAICSSRYARQCQKIGREVHLAHEADPVTVLDVETPVIALAGVFRPRVLLSRSVLNLLSGDQLDAAMRHEHAHGISRDNLKRFLILMAPGVFPLTNSLSTLERAWARCSEWAADDDATQGDERVALSLAAALVRVARMGAVPQPPLSVTPLIAGERDLAARVDRLLHDTIELHAPHWQKTALVCSTVAIMTIALIGATQWPGILYAAHILLERLIN